MFRLPVRAVAAWPAWEVRLLEQFISTEPPADVRLEVLGAKFAAAYFNFNSAAGAKNAKPVDFLEFHNAFRKEIDICDERYSELDREILGALDR